MTEIIDLWEKFEESDEPEKPKKPDEPESLELSNLLDQPGKDSKGPQGRELGEQDEIIFADMRKAPEPPEPLKELEETAVRDEMIFPEPLDEPAPPEPPEELPLPEQPTVWQETIPEWQDEPTPTDLEPVVRPITPEPPEAPVIKPPVKKRKFADKAKKKTRKKRGCFSCLFKLFIILILLAAAAVTGWYCYLVFIQKDKAVKERGIIAFAQDRAVWAADRAKEGYHLALSLFEEKVPPPVSTGTGTSGATGTSGKPAQTATAPPAWKIEREKRVKAEKLTAEGARYYRQASDRDWDGALLKKSENCFRSAKVLYNELQKMRPEDMSIDRELQRINTRLMDINKQKRLSPIR